MRWHIGRMEMLDKPAVLCRGQHQCAARNAFLIYEFKGDHGGIEGQDLYGQSLWRQLMIGRCCGFRCLADGGEHLGEVLPYACLSIKSLRRLRGWKEHGGVRREASHKGIKVKGFERSEEVRREKLDCMLMNCRAVLRLRLGSIAP